MSMTGVGFNYARPMSGDAPPPPKPPSYGFPGIIEGLTTRRQEEGQRSQRAGQAIFDWFRGIAPTPEPATKAKAGSGVDKTPVPQETEPGMSFAEYAAMFGLGGGGGGGAARPDLSAYRAALTDQANQINAQIQAMYNALGEQAQANLGRIQDVYGGAQAGVGDIYGSASENIGQAFSSAQQQAADQMARLGIEEAAGQVIPFSASQQAQALANLETGRAGGLSALERYGATGQDFASQMAQVAQQQGTEMNAAILASLQNRLMDTLAAEQAGGGGGGGGRGMSVSDQLRLQEAYRRDVLGELPLEDREFALREAETLAGPQLARREANRELFLDLTLPRDGQRPMMTPEEAEAYINALESRGY